MCGVTFSCVEAAAEQAGRDPEQPVLLQHCMEICFCLLVLLPSLASAPTMLGAVCSGLHATQPQKEQHTHNHARTYLLTQPSLLLRTHRTYKHPPILSSQGTSAPIAIPNMGAWRGGTDSKGGRQADAASTFIPPHQLSRQEDFNFSFTGASPGGALKRERLRARNAILRSTGRVIVVKWGSDWGASAAGQVRRYTWCDNTQEVVQRNLGCALWLQMTR